MQKAAQPYRGTAVIAAVWTLIVVVFTAHEYLSDVADARPDRLLNVLYWSMSEWYTWALLTPACWRSFAAFRSPG